MQGSGLGLQVLVRGHDRFAILKVVVAGDDSGIVFSRPFVVQLVRKIAGKGAAGRPEVVFLDLNGWMRYSWSDGGSSGYSGSKGLPDELLCRKHDGVELVDVMPGLVWREGTSWVAWPACAPPGTALTLTCKAWPLSVCVTGVRCWWLQRSCRHWRRSWMQAASGIP